MLQSRNRLLRDIDRWQSAGWIGSDGAKAIRADIAAGRTSVGLASVLAILAAVLVGFGVMSFVAANWQAMPKLARLAIIFGGMWSAFGGAAWLKSKEHPYFADAALLAAVAIYGAGIMLIAQMYHMDGHPPDAVLWWGLGAVATGLLARSNPVLAAALVLFCLWSGMEAGGGAYRLRVHWPFLGAWALTAAGFAWTRWKPGLHLISLALSWWIITCGYQVADHRQVGGHLVVTLVGLALVGASIGFGQAIDRWRRISGAMLAYGFGIAFAGAMAFQFAITRSAGATWLLAALVLLVIVGTLVWAWRTDNRSVLWLAYGAFSIEIFALYVQKIGTLLGTSAFFMVTGLMVAALAWAALRLHGAGPHAQAEGQTP